MDGMSTNVEDAVKIAKDAKAQVDKLAEAAVTKEEVQSMINKAITARKWAAHLTIPDASIKSSEHANIRRRGNAGPSLLANFRRTRKCRS
jgi:S-adenosylmethionine synthetase